MELIKFEPADTSSNLIYDINKDFLDSFYEHQLPKNVAVTQELLKYKTESCILLKSGPLVYWKISKSSVTSSAFLLFDLAARFFINSSFEQVFSVVRDVFDYLRSNFSPKC
jgi:hypothetical protein